MKEIFFAKTLPCRGKSINGGGAGNEKEIICGVGKLLFLQRYGDRSRRGL